MKIEIHSLDSTLCTNRPRFRPVLDFAIPLALSNVAGGLQSGRGLPHSKTLSQPQAIRSSPSSRCNRAPQIDRHLCAQLGRLCSLIFCLLIVNASKLSAAAPSITFQPKDQTVILYQPAAFGVIASGTAPLSYQWRKDGVPIADATNDHITLAQPQFSDGAAYSVIVSNAESSATSADAVLTVNSPKGGDVDCSFACGSSINGIVSCVAVQVDGKILIAGTFTTVDGAVRGGIARLNADGTTDYTFMNGLSGANNNVSSVAVQNDDKVLIVGDFTAVNGVSRRGIARLNPDGSLDGGFQDGLSGVEYLNGCCAFVNSLAVQSDSKVLIGGRFTTVNGVGRTNIARLNSDGTLDANFNPAAGGGTILTQRGRPIVIQSDGKVLLGVTRLNSDGSLDNGFKVEVGEIYSVAVQSDGKVLIGGWFAEVNGVRLQSIARLNANGTLDAGFLNRLPGISGGDYHVNSVTVQGDGRLLIGGSFTTVNGERRTNIARLNSDGTLDSSFLNGLSGATSNPYGPFGDRPGVWCVVMQPDGKVLIGGNFDTVNDDTRNGIARLNPDGTLDRTFRNGAAHSPSGSALPINPSAGHRLMARGFVAVAGPGLFPQRYPLGAVALTKWFAFRVVHRPCGPKTHPSWRPFEWSAAKAAAWLAALRCD
jgi:uncharacterized delta-60 repeat protein